MLKDIQLKLTPNSHYVSEGTLLLLAARKPRILIQLIAHFRCSGVSVQQIWGPQSFVVFISHCRRVCAIHRCLIVPWGWLRWHLLLECLKVPASALLVTCQFEKVPDSWYLWNWSTFFFQSAHHKSYHLHYYHGSSFYLSSETCHMPQIFDAIFCLPMYSSEISEIS